MWRIKRIFKKVWDFADSAANHRVGPYSAQASFFIMLSVIPFFMFLLSLLHMFLPQVVNMSETDIIASIYNVFPEQVSAILAAAIDNIMEQSSSLTIVTAATTLWLSSRGIMAVRDGVNNVFSDGELQNYFVIRALSVVYVLLFAVFIVLTIALYGFGAYVMQYVSHVLPRLGGVVYRIIRSRSIIMFILLTLYFIVFYKFMPKHRLKIKELIPGAAAAAIGWILFSDAFAIYIQLSKSYNFIYGGLSYIVFAMLWLYFCINIMLLGAELNYALKTGLFKD